MHEKLSNIFAGPASETASVLFVVNPPADDGYLKEAREYLAEGYRGHNGLLIRFGPFAVCSIKTAVLDPNPANRAGMVENEILHHV